MSDDSYPVTRENTEPVAPNKRRWSGRVRQLLRPLGRAVVHVYRHEPLGAWLGALWAALLLWRAHAAFMTYAHGVNVDEGYIVAFGQRLIDGQWLPYVDAVSHRGPMVYWLGALVALFTNGSWLPVRVAAALAFVTVALLTFLCGRRAGQPLAGAIGAVACAYASLIVLLPQDGIAFNGEVVLNLFVMAGFLCLIHGLDRGARLPSERWVAASAALAMLGALSKQVGGTILLPFGLWVLAAAIGHPTMTARQRWRLLIAFVAGAAAPLVLVLIRYAVVGHLKTFWYYFVTYNFDVYMRPYRGVSRLQAINRWMLDNLLVATLAIGALGWAFGRVAMAWTRGGLRSLPAAYHAAGFQTTVALAAVASLLGAQMAMRGWGHYYVQAVPWFGLLAGMIAEPWASPQPDQAPRPVRRLVYHLFVLVPMLVVVEAAYAPRHAAQSRHAPQPPAICATIQTNSRPDQKIFVWGFWADLHIWCKRRPASRFVFSTFVSGVIPWFLDYSKQQDDALAVPGSREQLIGDLEKSQAAIIVDGFGSIGQRPFRRYEKLAAYLDQHYRWLGRFDGADVYLRDKRNRRMLFDFESRNLAPGGWTVVGDAFVETDVTNHPPQGLITGYSGQRFVNSFTPRAGDAATGTAISPPFTIDRSHLGFVIGGGRACRISLRVDGQSVYEQAGSDTTHMFDHVWDVSRFRGKSAQLVLLDEATYQWGHLLLDRVELFDAKP